MSVKRHLPYKVCAECGCSLDAGEHCECEQRQEKKPPARPRRTAKQREAYDQYLDERQREWLYS